MRAHVCYLQNLQSSKGPKCTILNTTDVIFVQLTVESKGEKMLKEKSYKNDLFKQGQYT